MISKDDIVRLAGYLEGEGTFGAYVHNTRKKEGREKLRKFVIQVGSTDRDVIVEIARLFNSSLITESYQKRLGYKQSYRTAISGCKAIGWMMTLYSKMMSRRRKEEIRGIINEWRVYHHRKLSKVA